LYWSIKIINVIKDWWLQIKCIWKRFAGRHLLTLESQKLNYFGKKGGSAFWHYNIIRIWAMSGPFSRFLVIFYSLSPKYDHYVLWIYDYTIFCAIFFIHLKPRVESFWGVLSWCLAPSILFNFRYKKIKRKHIYLPHAQTAIYDSKVKLFLKQVISHQLGRDAVVWFECENWSLIFYEKYSTSLSAIVLFITIVKLQYNDQ
jgi:hypothetical protein